VLSLCPAEKSEQPSEELSENKKLFLTLKLYKRGKLSQMSGFDLAYVLGNLATKNQDL